MGYKVVTSGAFVASQSVNNNKVRIMDRILGKNNSDANKPLILKGMYPTLNFSALFGSDRSSRNANIDFLLSIISQTRSLHLGLLSELL